MIRLTPLTARRLEYVVAANDVGAEDPVPRPLDRITAQMHDCIHALCDAKSVGKLRDVGANEFFFFVDFFQRTEVGDLQHILAREFTPQMRPDVTCRARDQDGFHDVTPLWTIDSFTVIRHSVRGSNGSISVAECSSDALSHITKSPTLYLSR